MSTFSSSDGDNEATIVATEQQLEEQIDLLTEKSAETRLIALRFLNKHMRLSYANEEFFAKNKQTILEAIKRGLRKGLTPERVLSCESACLLSIRVGTESEAIYSELRPILKEMLLNPSLAHEVRAAACGAFSLTNFIANEDEASTTESLPMFRDIFSAKESNELLETAALNAYSLLLTTLDDQYIYDNLIPNDTLNLFDLLGSSNVEVRVAAGQCIALFFEVGRNVEGEDYDSYKFCYLGGIEYNELMDTLNELVSDKTKSRAKKDKLKQKEPFKDIVATVEFGDLPRESLLIVHQRVEFESWTQILQLNTVREYLGTGLQSHLEANELLHQIFDISIDLDKKKVQLTQIEKRKIMSPSSDIAKFRSRNLGSQRVNKTLALVADD